MTSGVGGAAETDLCKPPLAIGRRRHVWRPANIGRIMSKLVHAVATAVGGATTRRAAFAIPIYMAF